MKRLFEEKMNNKAVYFAGASFAAELPLCAAAAVFYHRAIWFGAALILLAVCAFVFSRAASYPGFCAICAAAAAVCGGLSLFLRGYFRVLLLFTLSFVFAAAGLFVLIIHKQKGNLKKLPLKQICAVFLIIAIALPLALGWFPDPLFRFAMQGGVMSHTPSPSDSVREDGVRVIEDIVYPSAYPNNTMTLRLAPDNLGTLFFVHGGGFVLGDKTMADNSYFRMWIDEGFNVVSFDYALAPQYRVDIQLIQCSQALRFFMEHAQEWGIDRSRVFLVGESAGGCLAGLLASAGVSPGLAGRLGIPDAPEYCGEICGFVSAGGLVDVTRFGDTNDDLSSWAFNLMGVSAFHSPAYAESDIAELFSVLAGVTADFPPSYLSDGNHGTFTGQAKDLAVKLRSLGVRVETNFIPAVSGRRGHVFELNPDTDPLALENFNKTLSFVKEILSLS